MSKENFEQTVNRTKELRDELTKRERDLAMNCSHTRPNKKGELRFTVYPTQNNLHRCEQCGSTFSLAPIQFNDLNRAVTVVHNALQQVRAFSDPFNDEQFIRELGRADYNVNNLPRYYQRTLSAYSSKRSKKKGNKSQNGFGSPF